MSTLSDSSSATSFSDIPGLRPQYHFRPSEHGLRAWNVAGLIQKSHDLEIFECPLDAITELDEAYWFGSFDPSQAPTCRAIAEHAKLMQDVDLRFPIILSSNGRIMDGMHRVCRALIEGRKTIRAVRFSTDPAPDHIGKHPDELSYDWGP